MVVVEEPEAQDIDTLLSGSHGKLLDAILSAFGTDRHNVYLASALPRHTRRGLGGHERARTRSGARSSHRPRSAKTTFRARRQRLAANRPRITASACHVENFQSCRQTDTSARLLGTACAAYAAAREAGTLEGLAGMDRRLTGATVHPQDSRIAHYCGDAT
ncbi:hypothetical protein ACFSHP_13575 [Novosphingobium panipatense]